MTKEQKKQTELFEQVVTTRFPKNHRLQIPKKTHLTFYDVKDHSTESILNKTKELGRDTFIVALSGGKDSSVVLDKATKLIEVDSAFYIKTNVGVTITETYTRDLCQSHGIQLHIREPTPHPFIYVAICLEMGFPSYDLHDMIMSYLKYKTMWKFITEPQFKHKKPVLLSGVRKFESTRRKFKYAQPIASDSDKLWFSCPIFYESDEQVYKYYLTNNLTRSPVYAMGATDSMECKCGCFASSPQEMELIKEIDPQLFDFFEWIREGIIKFGKPWAKRHAVWGGFNTQWTKEEKQEVIKKYLGSDADHAIKISQMICGAECGGGTMRGAMNF